MDDEVADIERMIPWEMPRTPEETAKIMEMRRRLAAIPDRKARELATSSFENARRFDEKYGEAEREFRDRLR